MSEIRRLGDGYEPHVDEVAGQLIYSLPVDSSIVSVDFAFAISTDDLKILVSDPYRRAALEVIAHTVLQRSMLQDGTRVTQAAFDSLILQVLHGTPKGLEDYIAQMSQDHHMVVAAYIEDVMARRASAQRPNSGFE